MSSRLLAVSYRRSVLRRYGAAGNDKPSIKDAFKDKFKVGIALSSQQVSGGNNAVRRLIVRNFNSIVADNCMKCEVIQPEEGRYDFTEADRFVDFGQSNGMDVIGHCLVWHSQLPAWFCVDKNGKPVSPEVLKKRMKEHITTVVKRYRGRVKGWDVVNEAILDDGSFRDSPFYKILGEEYIPLAFQYAHEADPDAELYYNDYGMDNKYKRIAVIEMVKKLKARGLRIDAIGMQGHMGMDYPRIDKYERSIKAFAATGCKVMITEWDMSALPSINTGADISVTAEYDATKNPYPNGLPDEVSRAWNKRMGDFLRLFLKYSDVISRVTVWGLTDADSWKNDYPMPGRTDYPLWFDRGYQMKPFLREFVAPKKAVFNDFVYSAPGVPGVDVPETANPILPGCYPDPTICRVGGDYYIANSSFAFFPAIPIWHSTDLKHWERLGYAINRPSQLQLKDGLRISGGIYAPDLKYNPHNKLFYLIVTDVDGQGNFFITTDDPKSGQWSDPVCLPDVKGIDPSFLFDDDGKAYILNNDAPEGTPLYEGHRVIWIREFDWKTGRTVGKQQMVVNGGVDISKKPVWIEGPHLYHVNGTYYIMCAEGGTSVNHTEVVFSSDKPFGPFKPCKVNPILTQLGLPWDRPEPVTCAGHADLVQTEDGDWKAVFLAVRPYKDSHDVMGRETFMLPVEWKDGQPIILKQGEVIKTADRPVKDRRLWTADGLANDAFFIRTPQSAFYKTGNDGSLELEVRPVRIDEKKQPSAVGQWVTHFEFEAQTSLDFAPENAGDLAGLVLFHNDECNVVFGKTLDAEGKPCLKLEARSKNVQPTTAVLALPDGEASKPLLLKVEGIRDKATGGVAYRFSYSAEKGGAWQTVGSPVSADLLSTHTAGGFTGTMIGVYATGVY